MARVVLPQSKIRQRRKKRRIRVATVVGGGLFLLCVIVVGMSWLPAVRVTTISVAGAHLASAGAVEHFVEEELKGRMFVVFPKNSVFLYPRDEIVERLRIAFPALHSVQIRADIPSNFDSITISAEERVSAALWCPSSLATDSKGTEQKECAFIDHSGIVYALAPAFSGAVYIRYFGEAKEIEAGKQFPKQFLTPDSFAGLVALVEALRTEVGPLSYIAITKEEDVEAVFGNGFSVFFVLQDDGAETMERFRLAREAEPFKDRPLSDFQYLDLRFGDKLYYKVKGE